MRGSEGGEEAWLEEGRMGKGGGCQRLESAIGESGCDDELAGRKVLPKGGCKRLEPVYRSAVCDGIKVLKARSQ